MVDMNYFRAIQGSIGISDKPSSKIVQAQNNLSRELHSSINEKSNSTRNGKSQSFLLIPDNAYDYKCKFIAFPNEELYVGDIISVDGANWIIVETNLTNPIQTIGKAWLCNHLFRFQNYDSTIYEYWGVIDDGTYSANPQSGDSTLHYLNQRVDIYLPYDDITKYIYIDKRLAADTIYDKNGKSILEVYELQSRRLSMSTYGKGSHLLVFEAQSGQFNPDEDNLLEEICDYISPEENTLVNNDLLPCQIVGRNTIRCGGSARYGVEFYNSDGETVLGVTPIWNLQTDIEGVGLKEFNGIATIEVKDIDSVVGETICLQCTDTAGLYNKCTFEIEVI